MCRRVAGPGTAGLARCRASGPPWAGTPRREPSSGSDDAVNRTVRRKDGESMVDIYWVEDAFPGRVGVAGLPRGGAHLERELADLAAQGVTTLVTALPADEL